MKVWEFCIAGLFCVWLTESGRRQRFFPTVERAPMEPRKLREALRTFQDAVIPDEVIPEMPQPRPYQELQEEAMAEVAALELEIENFGPSGATFMENEPGYTGDPLPEDVE